LNKKSKIKKKIFLSILRSQFNNMKTITGSMSSSNPVLTCKVIEEKLLVDENSQFDITISIADILTSTTIPNIAWNVNDLKI
jgi:hypothetical protein